MKTLLGTPVESLRVVEIIGPLVKTRKKTEELPLHDTFRLIRAEIAELGIEGVIKDRVDDWISKSKKYKSG